MNTEYPATQICFSTENQMVNLIPIQMLKPQQIGYFTIENPDKNKKWDENLKRVIGSTYLKTMSLTDQAVLDIENLKEIMNAKLLESNMNDRQLLWNITGGQRYFIIAAYELFSKRNGDVLCYLEGNKNTIVFLKNEDMKIKKLANRESNIAITIEDAIKLMGFNKGKAEPDCLIHFEKARIEFPIKKFEPEIYLKFFEAFLNSDDLKQFCRKMNRTREKKDNDKSEFARLFDQNSSDEIWKILGANYYGSFGKVFEFMAGAKIFDIINQTKNHPVNEIAISNEVIFGDTRKEKSQDKDQTIDEFDIAIMTKNGKFIIFECKTGNMSADNAKSHRYSTYAIGGVYGLPVLLVPLTRDEINSMESKKIDDDLKNLQKSINAGKRAQLKEWAIDEIEVNLKKKLNLINTEK